MKFPTIKVGMPYGSLRIVNEKQQSIVPCSLLTASSGDLPLSAVPGVVAPDDGRAGL